MAGAPPFASLLVVGAGLLGTSVALAVRRRWPEVRLIAIDTVPRDHALKAPGTLVTMSFFSSSS